MKVGMSKSTTTKLFDAKLSHECRESKNIWKINSLFFLWEQIFQICELRGVCQNSPQLRISCDQRVGKLNFAPSLIPVGQREVTALRRV